jgi:hypothetical protein
VAQRFVLVDHHQIPGYLPKRTCKGLYDAADVPGTANLGESAGAGGSTQCLFGGGTDEDPIDVVATLVVAPNATAAHSLFEEFVATGLTPKTGIGDESASGTSCVQSSCGPGGVVRVANDVIGIGVSGETVDFDTLLAKGVTELCPDCQFPTSPAP